MSNQRSHRPGQVKGPMAAAVLAQAGIVPGMVQLLITREWAIMAGENERITTGVRDLTGHEPRSVEEFLHGNADAFR